MSATLLTEARELLVLVALASLANQLGMGVLGRTRLRPLAANDTQSLLRQVLAGEVVGEIGGREDQRAVGEGKHVKEGSAAEATSDAACGSVSHLERDQSARRTCQMPPAMRDDWNVGLDANANFLDRLMDLVRADSARPGQHPIVEFVPERWLGRSRAFAEVIASLPARVDLASVCGFCERQSNDNYGYTAYGIRSREDGGGGAGIVVTSRRRPRNPLEHHRDDHGANHG